MIKKVNKTQAIKHWRNGEHVGLIPCKFSPHSMWVSVYWVNKSDYIDEILFAIELQEKYPQSDDYYKQYTKDADIDLLAWNRMFDNFAYYNLNNEMGKYPHYYIEVKL